MIFVKLKNYSVTPSCHPECKRRIHIFLKSGRLRFTSSKIDSNFSHRSAIPLFITFVIAHRNWRYGVGGFVITMISEIIDSYFEKRKIGVNYA